MKENKNLEKVWNYINNFENEYKLLNFKIYDFPIWIGCKEKAIDLMMGNTVHSGKGNIISNMGYIIIRSIDAFFKLPFIKPVDVLFVSNSRFRRGDSYSDSSHIYFDNIIDNLSSNTKVGFLEYPTLSDFDLNYIKSRHSNIVLPIDIFIPFAQMGKFIKRKEIIKAEKEIDILLSINSEFDKNLIDSVSKWMKQLAEEWISWTFALEWIYKKFDPKVIVDIANAARFSQPILKNVKKIELQHGVIHKFHPSYSFTLDGKKQFSIGNENKYLIVYSEYYKDVITKYGNIIEENITVIENMRLWNFDFKEKSEIYKRLNLLEKKKIILLSSQPLKEAQNSFINFIEYFLTLKSQNSYYQDYAIVVKLHPRESIDNSIYRKYEKSIRITREEISLLDLLNVSKAHIGYTSTVIEEASDFNLLNFILCDRNVEDKYGHLIKTGKAIKINDMKEIIDILDNKKNFKKNLKYIPVDYLKANPYISICNKINDMLIKNHSEENNNARKT